MTITVDVRPEVQAELKRQASQSGSQLEDYAASLLEAAVLTTPALEALPVNNKARIENLLRGMAQFSHKIPVLPNSAFSRDSLYQDHD